MNRGAPSRERAVAIQAVRDAARICRAVRATFEPGLTASKKDQSPVTVADLASQAIVSLALADAFPYDPIMGEEDSSILTSTPESAIASAVVDHVTTLRPEVDADRVRWALDRCSDAGGPTGRHWVLDPVDGTLGYVRGGQYAVALGLIQDGQVVLGVLACPNLPVDPDDPGAGLGCVFVAERGGGSWQVPLDDAGEPSEGGESAARPIHVHDVTDVTTARYTESYEPAHSAQSDAAAIAGALGITSEPLRMDSQAKYAVVARGEAEIYLRLPRPDYVENAWDHAAGWLLLREAGGSVSDATGAEIDFSTGRRLTRNRGIVATASAIHARVLLAVEQVLAR